MTFCCLVNFRSLCLRVRKMTLNQDGLENNESCEIRKTKIVRPEDKIMEEPAAVKGIRGRRRVLCPVRVAPINGPNRTVVNSSPPQQTAQTSATTSPAKSSGKTTPVTRAAQSRGRSASPASPSPVRPNRTSALRQNTTQSQKAKCPSVPALESQVRLRANSKSPRVSSAPCSPRQLPVAEQDAQQLKRRSLEMASRTSNSSPKSSPPKSESVPVIDPQHPPLASIGKQGTFTKEKSSSPEGAAAAKAEEEQSVKIPPKVPPKPKIPAAAAKPALPKKPSRFNNGPSPLSSPRSKGSPALSRRSVSSASIGSDSTSATTTWSGVEDQAPTPPQKRTPPKKVVASKIASLWKQVEESRSKQKTEQPDVRKWISRGDSAKPCTEDKSVGTGCSPDQTPRPIVSSGTFEKLSSFSNSHQVPVIPPVATNCPSPSDKRSPPSRLPFRLPRFGRSSQSNTPTTPTLPTPPSPGFDVLNSSSSDAEDKRKFRVTAL